MELVLFLIVFPLVLSLVMPVLKNQTIRNMAVMAGMLGVLAGAVALLVVNFHQDVRYYPFESVIIDKAMLLLEIVVGGYLFYQGFRAKRPAIAALVLAQVLLMVVFELAYGHQLKAEYNLFLDRLSVLMALVVGVVGGLICLYAIGYMKDFHSHYHNELQDRRRFFFFTLFLFLSAMFGVIFSNNLIWLYFFWEITTLCSFLLIGYKQNEESRNNAFRALFYNLIGGLAFAVGIVVLYFSSRNIELHKVMAMGKGAALLPVALISVAGLTKSAQLPFSSWLLGAMVAPTPVSAMLHSSTMVKAGVYIILRFASVLQGTYAGVLLGMIGGVTFLAGSMIAITCSDAKKILAYSTIANLGLIVLCAGVGTYEAIWAAALLILFHAVAKCLLFLCVGTIEHRIHSRDIEDMSALILSMPKLSIMMQIGMCGMFLAPFGMLISKWVVLKALVDSNPLLAIFVVFGSSASLLFWVKWMGTLLVVTGEKDNLEEHVSGYEWTSLTVMSFLTISVCLFFPLLSSVLIEPYVIEIYGKTVAMSSGNIVIMSIMLGMVLLFPLSFFNYGKRVKVVDAYLGGANNETHTQFRGSADMVRNMTMKNYYLERYFGETMLFKYSSISCLILIVVMFMVVYL